MVELYPLKVNVEELSIAFGESKIIVSFRFGSVPNYSKFRTHKHILSKNSDHLSWFTLTAKFSENPLPSKTFGRGHWKYPRFASK